MNESYILMIALISALVLIMISVINLKHIINRISIILFRMRSIELSIKEVRTLLLVIGLLIIMFCGLFLFDIPSIMVCIIGIGIGFLILCAGVFNIKVILVLVLIPNVWLSSFNNKMLRVIVSIFGCAILIASISGIFAIK